MLMYFVLPSSRPIAFEKLFRFNDGSTEIILKTLSQKRNDFVAYLAKPTTSEAGIALAKDYIPHLLGLIHCIETQPDLRTYTPLSTRMVAFRFAHSYPAYTWMCSVAGEYAKSKEYTSASVYLLRPS